MELQKFHTSLEIPITYIHTNQGQDKPLIVLFHGFADSAKAVLRRVYPEADDRYEVLAINGPFPVPQKKGDEWKHAFAWYFADFSKGTVYIPPQAAVKAVRDLLAHLGLDHRKKILIGFSQGGFFLPHALPHITNVQHLIAVGAAYRPDDYHTPLAIPLDALHGSLDEVISIERSRHSFEALKSKNPGGHFIELAGLGHTLNDDGRLWIRKKIDQVFS